MGNQNSGSLPGVPKKNGNGTRILKLGELPKKLQRQGKNVLAYRRDLEKAVKAAKGKLSKTDEHLIDEATGWELHKTLCVWLLRTREEKMTPSDIMTCSREIARARSTRNRLVELLKIDVPEPPPWEQPRRCIESEVIDQHEELNDK